MAQQPTSGHDGLERVATPWPRSRRWLALVGVVLVVTAGAALAGRALIDAPVASSRSLSDAVAGGDLDRVRQLLADGADPDGGRVHGFTPLARAALRDDVAMVEALVAAGADLEATTPGGMTTLHVASEADAADAAAALIEAGADTRTRSKSGMNALDHAAAAGSVDVIEVLVDAGIEPDAPSEVVTQGHGYPIDVGSTPLAIAARAGHRATVEALLDAGADVDARSTRGQTALIQAIVSGQGPDLITVLVDAGADVSVRVGCQTRCADEEGDALDWAQRLGHPDVIPLLEAAAAEPSSG